MSRKVNITVSLDESIVNKMKAVHNFSDITNRALHDYLKTKKIDEFDAWWNALAGAEKERLLGAAEKACVLNGVSDKNSFLWAWWLDGSWKEKVLGK